MKQKLKICLIGTGSLGTALSYLILQNKHQLDVYEPNQKNLHQFLTHKKISKFPNLNPIENFQKCFSKQYNYVIPCIPSKNIDSFYQIFFQKSQKTSHIISISKGLYPNSLQTISQKLSEKIPHQKISVLSGPTFANEILSDIPTCCTIATHSTKKYNQIKEIFNTKNFNCTYSNNIIATELGGILKNCYAITLGILDQHTGMNTKSAAITKIINEVTQLYKSIKIPQTQAYSLSFLGDLVATGLNPESRNTQFGKQLKSKKNTTIEGADNLLPMIKFASKYHIDLTILKLTSQIISHPQKTQIQKLTDHIIN